LTTLTFDRIAALMLVLPLLLLGGCNKADSDYMALAKAAFQSKDFGAAQIHLKNLLAKEPNNGEARVLMGQALLDGGDPTGAAIEFKRAREQKVDDNRVVPLLAEAMISAGESRLLIEQFGTAKLSSPESAARLSSSLAMAYLTLKRTETAREVIDAALKLAPKSSDARITLARIQSTEGKPGEALSTIDALLKDDPGLERAWALKGYLLESTDATKEAIAAYAKALEINPKQLEGLYAGAMLEMQRGDLKAARMAFTKLEAAWPRNPNTLYVEARLNHLEGKYAAARPMFAAVINVAPENVATLISAGLNELKLDAPIQAEALLARAVSLQPSNSTARFLLAQAYLRLGKPDKATSTLAQLLETKDVSAGVLVAAAQAKLMQGDATGADQLFSRAEKLKSSDAGVRTALASARMARFGEADAALRELEQISQSSESTDADLRVISARLARREWAPALEAIAKLEAKTPSLASGPELRGQALLLNGDAAAARAAFEEALKRDKFYAPALAQLTALDLKEGKQDQARQRLQGILAADRDNSQALTMLAMLSVQTGSTSAEVLELLERATKSDPLNLNAWMTLLMRHFNAGDFPAAMLAAQTAMKAIPENVQLMDLTGRIQLAAGNLNQANSTFADLIKVAPRSAAGYMGLASALVAGNDIEAATKVVQRLVAMDPQYIDAQRMAAELAVRRRRYGEALDIARLLQRQFPADAAGYLVEAQVEAQQNHRPQFIAALRVAAKKTNPQAAPVQLHGELLRSGDKALAGQFAEEWLKLHPKDAAFLSYVGDTELDAKNWQGALTQYERALAINPQHVPALNNAAMALLNLKDDTKAMKYVERALVVQPNRPEVLDTLAQIHMSRKDYSKAAAALRLAIGRATDPGPLQLSLAQVYVAQGDNASAIAELQAIVERGKASPLYPQARKQLAQLRSR
jgi:putative PEP-CTERM system TPR-repeat lipoprotein